MTMNGHWKPIMHITVENVTYAIGSVCEVLAGAAVADMHKSHLNASPNDTTQLNLMFGDDLRESNQDTNLQCHLSVILHAISAKDSRKVIFGSKKAYKKRSAFFSTANSIQLRQNAIRFEKVTTTTMNLIVSMPPHSRSK